MLLAGLAQLLGPFGMGMFFGGGVFLVEDGAGGTHIHAFAARGAALHLPPGLVEPRHDPAFSTAVGHIPHMGPLDLITNAHAATTENAAVVVNGEELVGGIHRAVGVLVGETGVVHTHRHCSRCCRC